ncbi:MAG: hypothetical protein AB1758_27765 [Candidatus Eremiobacterota bacterium]
MIITTGLFSLMVLTVFVILRAGLRAWSTVESRHTAQRQLRRVELLLNEDLKSASIAQMRVLACTPVGSPMAGTPNGHAVWFLSPQVPVDTPFGGVAYAAAERGVMARDPSTGQAVWQTNILYYLSVPIGYTGAIGAVADADGLDVTCPRKMLVKVVVDINDQRANIFDPGDAEPLLTNAQVTTTYAIAPNGYSLANIVNKNRVVTAQIIADQLLYFGVKIAPAGAPPKAVDFRVRAMRVADAEHNRSRVGGQLGTVDATRDSFTIEYVTRLFLQN